MDHAILNEVSTTRPLHVVSEYLTNSSTLDTNIKDIIQGTLASKEMETGARGAETDCDV